MRLKTGLSTGVLLAAMVASSQVSAETLDEALAYAYSNNSTLAAQRAKVRATDETVPQALSNWRPTVSLTGAAGYSNTRYNDSPQTPATATALNSYSRPASAGVGISEPLYRGGRTVAQTEQAEAQVRAERARLAAIEQQVFSDVVTAYMNVVLNRAVVDLNVNNEQVLQRQLDATNNRFRVGEVTRTDVAQSEARLSAAHAGRRQAEGDLQVAKANYLNVVGHADSNAASPSPVSGLPLSAEDTRTLATQENPSVVAAQYDFEAAEHGVRVIEGELLPTVSLNAEGARNKDWNGPYTYERVGQATVNVTVPIYQQGQEYSRIRQQKHTAGQAKITVDVQRRDAVETASRAWEQLQTARARILSFRDQVNAESVALEGVRRESQVGSRTVLDVLNAEQELLSARVSLVTAEHDELIAEYAVKAAVGQLTAQGLALSVDVYDPSQHYEEVRGKWVGTSVSPTYGDVVQ